MFAIIAPARLASTRFPEKLLHPILGKPLILWVAERIKQQVPEAEAFFAVDDERLRSVVEKAGFRAIMTSKDHQSGTDRLAEANEQIGADIVVNVQADEPLVAASQIQALRRFIEERAEMATLATPFKTRKDFLDPNQVKVVMGDQGDALYFSRSAIPHYRDGFATFDDQWVANSPVYRHLGLYAYRAEFLKRFCQLPQGKLEAIEKLEQLRALENGVSIKVGLTDEPSIGIDTAEDAKNFAAYLSK
ncbi:3-deoxy-manno-octulosonate cytidylyltransferase [Pelagicoccus sp. SDUM812003]|uniref:3-deoxy-manno-octulosonate cytidylyltransferase n=1 Tax=Pelagicoccus sp. SDUM812003 TaxID=3041267 RepID=UPI00280FC878|nr:3-deoxy-manno-octulosonate cytidylyltransferase [Pelagicoccus sp. SDUM812003]MDQ8205055.1 3-deoxy-manno-octulosonate cytidylyltransferase [Pelagicoccus sp. SDUM812003]